MFNRHRRHRGFWARPVISGDNTANSLTVNSVTAVCSSWKALVANGSSQSQAWACPPSPKPLSHQRTSLVVTMTLKWFSLADVLDKTFLI